MWVEGWGDLPGRLIVVSGPSGSGKSTLVRRLLERPEVRRPALGLGDDAAAPARRAATGSTTIFLTPRRVRGGPRPRRVPRMGRVPRQPLRDPGRAGPRRARRGAVASSWRSRSRGRCRSASRSPTALLVFIDAPSFDDARGAAPEPGDRGRGDDPPPAGQRPARARRWPHWYDHSDHQRRPRPGRRRPGRPPDPTRLRRLIARCSKN